MFVKQECEEYCQFMTISTEIPLNKKCNLNALFFSTRRYLLKRCDLIKGVGKTHRAKYGLKHPRSLLDYKYSSKPAIREQASKILEIIIRKDVREIKNFKTVPDISLLYCFTPEDILYLDIETTGFINANIFLIGIGEIRNNSLFVTQLFARNLSEEYHVIKNIIDIIKNKKCIVSYNGKSFDIRLLNERVFYFFNEYLDLNEKIHVDLIQE
ncbi:MAG: ribonuclease H-like domain-containing protein, partial [Promethearchaeota archaeon]